jgi:midasin
VRPYFEDVFEGLCQFLDIRKSSSKYMDTSLPDRHHLVRAKASLLARRPTKSIVTGLESTPSRVLSHLRHSIGLECHYGPGMVLQGRFHIAVLEKL